MLKIAVLLIALAALFEPAYGSQEMGILRIKVADDDRTPIANVLVEVKTICEDTVPCPDKCPSSKLCDSKDTNICCIGQSLKTNEKGVAEFRLQAANYKVRVSLTGFVERTLTLRVNANEMRSEDITLQKAPTAEDILMLIVGKVVDENNQAVANVTVQVADPSCVCESCPSGTLCSSNCCDCRQRPCRCCIDHNITTNSAGEYTMNVASGSYDVKYIKDGKSMGTLSGVKVQPKKKVTLNVRLEERTHPK